ncbi:MarR family winged helix-turn-helix transcriptional regulator [Cellulomonas sp. McL0617]|uniref:MarR family winged helix-turn-helix transcriptional regulator n=1 Tax=Cellulomonas sp. McL0617 TaxID=3415675 RepID=UPI003CFBB345
MTDESVRAALELRVVIGRLRRQLREVSATGDLTPSQTSLLSRLDRDGAASASDLAAAERVRPQSVAAQLTALDELGLIERHPDPTDGRRQLITLSGTGVERLSGDRQARQEWLARAIDERFSYDERRTLMAALALLDRLAEP